MENKKEHNKFDIEKGYLNSLLHNLSNIEIQQIFYDYNNFEKSSHTFFIDANDMLFFVDPYNLIYSQNNIITSKSNLADNFFAINALIQHKKGDIYLLDEYLEEFEMHKKRFNDIVELSEDLNVIIQEKELVNSNEIRSFISDYFSEIFFILKRRNKTIYDLSNELFSKIKINNELEQWYFDDPSLFSEKEHSDKIEMIYDLFPKNQQGYSSLIDSICIYKVFLMNNMANYNNKYIYYSSASKSKTLFQKLYSERKLPKWNWLKEIISTFPDEKLSFFRNNSYNFGYIVYRRLNQQIHSHDRMFIEDIFKDYCRKRTDGGIINEIINKLREEVENNSIFIDCKLNDDELEKSKKNNKNINYLITEIKKLKDLKKQVGKYKIDFINETFFSLELVHEVKNYLKQNKISIDRGRDNIISLFNILPPLFSLNNYSPRLVNYTSYKSIVEKLIIHASTRKQDKYRISQYDVNNIIENYISLRGKKVKTLKEVDNLLIIFLIIFIRYKSHDKVNSNVIAYKFCKQYEKQIENKLNKIVIRKSSENEITNTKDKYIDYEDNSLEDLKIELEFILKELRVLKIWASRRKDLPKYLNKKEVDRQIEEHQELIHLYPEDYRFKLSLFLTKLNYLYKYKKLNININQLINYSDELITLGKTCRESIEKLENFFENSFLVHTHKTVINSISFCICIKLDLLLTQNSQLISKKTRELFKELVKYKELRKKLNSRFVDSYDEKKLYQPVFPYVESYIEYIEAYMSQRDDPYNKLAEAKKSINIAINNLTLDINNRSYFLNHCKILRELIIKKQNDLTLSFKSFISEIDEHKLEN